MTAFEKFVLVLIGLWLLAHAARKYGREARLPDGVITFAETLVTA
jgi:hypothetical protein